jgi:uncharacterized membrane protein YjjP (DUF1212 family)
MHGYGWIGFRMFGMIWLANGIGRIVFHRPEAYPYILMGIFFWVIGVSLAFLTDGEVEYRSSPSAFAGGIAGIAIWGYINHHQTMATALISVAILILAINFFLIFCKKLVY